MSDNNKTENEINENKTENTQNTTNMEEKKNKAVEGVKSVEKNNKEEKKGKPELKVVDGKKKPRKRVKPPKKASNIKKLKAIKPKKKDFKKFAAANKTSLIAIAAIAVILIIAFVINSNNIIKIGEKQVMFSKEYSMSSKADFYVRGENIFYSSKDGMLFLDKKGEPLWSDTFTMSAPYMLSDGDYVALADSNSKTVNVYDKTGRLYQIAAAGPITTFAINPLGCCAVVCKVNDDYRVDVYSNTGETMFECARASKDGIPAGIDISDDGSIVAITIIDYNDIKVKSSVLFYYTARADANSTESSDGLISAVEVPEAIAPIVRFMPDNHCIAASDKSIMCINCTGKNKFNKEWEKIFGNYVTAFDIVDNNEIAIAYGEAMDLTSEEAAVNENTIHWYSITGRETGSAKSEERIDDIFSSDKGTIAASGKNYTAFNSRGRELWKYSAIQNVKSMLFYNKEDRVILVTPTKMQLLDVKKGVTMQEEETQVEESTSKENETQTTTKAK